MINVFYRRQNGLHELSQDKENVPPSCGQKLARKQRRINKCDFLITRGKWTNEALEEAMDAIENGTTSLKKVSRHWNIPFTSLSDHLYGKIRSKKPRLACMLTVEEDHVMIAWVFCLGYQLAYSS